MNIILAEYFFLGNYIAVLMHTYTENQNLSVTQISPYGI